MKNITTTITGLPKNSIIVLNNEEYLLDNGTITFDGGVDIDLSRTFLKLINKNKK